MITAGVTSPATWLCDFLHRCWDAFIAVEGSQGMQDSVMSYSVDFGRQSEQRVRASLTIQSLAYPRPVLDSPTRLPA